MDKTASFFERAIAFVIDMFIVGMIVSICTMGFSTRRLDNLNDKLNVTMNNYVNGKIESLEYIEEYSEIIYDINKAQFNYNVVYLVILVGYFIFFQYMNDGRSIGKQLMKLRIVGKDNNSVSFIQIVIRTFLIDEIFSVLVNVILVSFCGKVIFLFGYSIVSIIENLLIFISIFMLLYRKDKLALHDLISHSMVVRDV